MVAPKSAELMKVAKCSIVLIQEETGKDDAEILGKLLKRRLIQMPVILMIGEKLTKKPLQAKLNHLPSYFLSRIGGFFNKIFEDDVTLEVGDMGKMLRVGQKVTLEIRILNCFIQ